MTNFHATRMGQRFYEHTVPELVRQLDRLNTNLERITATRGEPDGHEDEDRDDNSAKAGAETSNAAATTARSARHVRAN